MNGGYLLITKYVIGSDTSFCNVSSQHLKYIHDVIFSFVPKIAHFFRIISLTINFSCWFLWVNCSFVHVELIRLK